MPPENVSCNGCSLMIENKRLKAEICRLSQQIEQLESLASTDPLTGISNRRKLEEDLLEIIDYNQRYNRRSALLFFDVNRLKAINDTFGHLIGDQALIFIADFLKKNVRSTDRVYRFAGDEFVVVLSNTTTLADARNKMARLENELANTCFFYESYSISLSVSVGCEVINGKTDLTQLLNSADKHMYEKKRCLQESRASL